MPCVRTVDTYVAVCDMTAAIRPNGASLLTGSIEQGLITKDTVARSTTVDKVWCITGAGSGLGAGTARAA